MIGSPWRRIDSRQRRNPGRPGGVRLLGFFILLLICTLTSSPADAEKIPEPVIWVFGDGNTASLDPERGLIINPPGHVSDTPLLLVRPERPLIPRQRRRTGPDIFTQALYEGVENGHRGLSLHADDDLDGRIDEDRADGMDNDGDGRIDEDFAAIGDRMQILDIADARGVQHVEIFHWAYPHLRETLFVKWQRGSRPGQTGAGPRPGALILDVAEGDWRVYNLDAETGSGAVVHISPVRVPEGWRWLGIAVLDNCGSTTADLGLEGSTLRISHQGDLSLAVIMTETLQGMDCRARVACATFAGASPRPDAPAVPWLVPPQRSLANYPEQPQARLVVEANGPRRVELKINKGWHWLPDPGKMAVDGRRLGPPDEISWLGDNNPERVSVDWKTPSTDMSGGLVEYVQDYPGRREINSASSGGTLVFTYENPGFGPEALTLTLESLCGQSLTLEAELLVIDETFIAPEALSQDALETDPPTLSRDLLEIYPNPFRDTVLMRFTIPRLVAEGFVWDKDRPPLIDPDSPIPYESESPQVSLRVYSLAGHEVASLYEGACSIGQYNASWNGISDSGRLMATGTYFCKLQIDKWSATRRLVLLR